MNKQSVLTILLTALIASGCASTEKRLAQDMAEREKLMRKAEEERREHAQKEARREIKAVPKWAMRTPSPDSTGIYAVGMAQSDQIPVAMRKAELQGKYALAKQVNEVISGLERANVTDNGQTTLDGFSQRIESLVDWADVAGTEVVKQEVVPIDGRFHAFYLYKLPFEATNRVLQERLRKAHAQSEREAFSPHSKPALKKMS